MVIKGDNQIKQISQGSSSLWAVLARVKRCVTQVCDGTTACRLLVGKTTWRSSKFLRGLKKERTQYQPLPAALWHPPQQKLAKKTKKTPKTNNDSLNIGAQSGLFNRKPFHSPFLWNVIFPLTYFKASPAHLVNSIRLILGRDVSLTSHRKLLIAGVKRK